MPEQIRAILFDVDGTLLDTFEFIYQSFEHSLAKHGHEVLNRERIAQTMGGPLAQCYEELVPGCDALALAETHRVFQTEHLDLVRLFPGTLTTLGGLRNRDIRLGAVTTRSKRTSVRSMEITGIADLFEVIISAEDVTRLKPDPEPLERALSFMGIHRSEALMVGDTAADIRAGKNAGVRTVAALYGFGGPAISDEHPDYSISSIEGLLELVARLNHRISE